MVESILSIVSLVVAILSLLMALDTHREGREMEEYLRQRKERYQSVAK